MVDFPLRAVELNLLGTGLLEVLIGLLDAFHLLVAELEWLHEALDDGTATVCLVK